MIKNKQYCDLHIHTIHSDGERSVSDLLKFAKQKNLFKLSITDHDCVDAYFELENDELRASYPGQILIGCEFVCEAKETPIEILGYGFDYHKMKPYLDEYGLPQSRLDRIHCEDIKSIAKMFGIKSDFNYDTDYLECNVPMKFKLYLKDMLNNERFYNSLVDINPALVESFSKLSRLGINNINSPLYQKHDFFPSAEKIINQIHDCGGLAFLAHPYQYGVEMFNILNLLKDKLDGVECYHFTCETEEKQKVLLDFCKEHYLLSSGGSDYHYIVDKKHNKDKLNEFKVPEKYFDIIANNANYEKPLVKIKKKEELA